MPYKDPDRNKQCRQRYYERHRAEHCEIVKRSQARYPEKVLARSLARKLKPQPCEVCGAEPAEKHHDDYDKPLDVRWLCKQHHTEHHYAEV